jgi:hypothetical protein
MSTTNLISEKQQGYYLVGLAFGTVTMKFVIMIDCALVISAKQHDHIF